MDTIVVVVKDGAVRWVFGDKAYRVVVLDDDVEGTPWGEVVEVNDHQYIAKTINGDAAPEIVEETLNEIEGRLQWIR